MKLISFSHHQHQLSYQHTHLELDRFEIFIVRTLLKKTSILPRPIILMIPVNQDFQLLSHHHNLAQHIEHIIITTPTHSDGRFFTLIRQCREKWQFTKHIFIEGPIIPDQFSYIYECGANGVLYKEDNMDIYHRAIATPLLHLCNQVTK